MAKWCIIAQAKVLFLFFFFLLSHWRKQNWFGYRLQSNGSRLSRTCFGQHISHLARYWCGGQWSIAFVVHLTLDNLYFQSFAYIFFKRKLFFTRIWLFALFKLCTEIDKKEKFSYSKKCPRTKYNSLLVTNCSNRNISQKTKFKNADKESSDYAG